MRKTLLLVAVAMTAFSLSAEVHNLGKINFNVYTYGGGGTSGTGTGGSSNNPADPAYGISSYNSQGATEYELTYDDANEVYTIKSFLNGSDYQFKAAEGTMDDPNGKLGMSWNITEVGTYTKPTEYAIFSKNGIPSFRISNFNWAMMHTTSRISLDGTKIYFRRSVNMKCTYESSTDGNNWSSVTASNNVLVAGIIPSPESIAGVDEIIADDNAPVEYFNLQGMSISNPQAGQLVIRRQGSKVSKIVVR